MKRPGQLIRAPNGSHRSPFPGMLEVEGDDAVHEDAELHRWLRELNLGDDAQAGIVHEVPDGSSARAVRCSPRSERRRGWGSQRKRECGIIMSEAP